MKRLGLVLAAVALLGLAACGSDDKKESSSTGGGQSSKEIGFALGLSSKTVDVHRARIMDRLDIRDVPGLVMYALRKGLI